MLRRTDRLLALILLCGVGQAGKSMADDAHFIGRLPQGTVELVGITNYPATNQSQWWQPDGSAAPIGPFRPQRPHRLLALPYGKALVFLVRIENLPADASSHPVFAVNPSPFSWRPLAGSPSWEVSSVVDAHGATIVSSPGSSQPAATYRADTYAQGNSNYKMFSAVLAAFAQTIDFRVGINMGAWETVISWKADSAGTSSFRRDGQEWTVTFHKATTRHNATKGDTTQVGLTSTYTYGQWNKRLVAVASDGSEHATSIGYNEGGDNGPAVFHDLPLSSIKEFRLQVRPYYWVEFQNVSLQSGQKTDVKVVSPGDSVNTEK
jgi:hypothetical protein